MVKVSIIGSTGIIGKNVAFTLAREDTVDEIVMFSRPKSLDKAKGEKRMGQIWSDGKMTPHKKRLASGQRQSFDQSVIPP